MLLSSSYNIIFKSFVFLLSACFFVFGVNFPSEANAGKEKVLWAVSSPPKSLVVKSQKEIPKSVSQNPAKPLKTTPKEPEESIPAFDRDNPIAKGVILAFHRWPNEKEKALLLKKLTKAGLKKKSELKRFKAWIFEWPEWRKGEKAVQLCKKISALPFLDYCEPNFLLGPAQISQGEDSSQDSKKKDQDLRQSKSPIRGSIFGQGRFGQGRNLEQGPPVIPLRGKNIRDCNLVSSEFGLFSPPPAVSDPAGSEIEIVGSSVSSNSELLPSPQSEITEASLSDYWAQERVGTDLLKEELEKAPPVKKHLVAVFDTSYQNRHDISVKNLISDKGRHSVLPEIDKFTSVHDVSKIYPVEVIREKEGVTVTDTSYTSAYLVEGDALLNKVENICGDEKEGETFLFPESSVDETRTVDEMKSQVSPSILDKEVTQNSPIIADENPYEQCEAALLPSFINNSMSWGYGDHGRSVYDAFNALSPPSVVVTSAGNDYPKRSPSRKARASRDFDMIIVGSLSPSGNKSYFSQEGLEVHIMAPSDNYITSADEDGNYKRFSGTSGATPLVTGSLAGFEWLSGYHPTAEEAKILLEKTAILTKYSHDKPRKNGVGMLNAYKLGMVGKRLKEQCGDDIYCFKNMIRKDSTYKFPEDKDLSQAVEQAFPECNQTCGDSMESSCVDKGSVFKSLRKASFLNPSNKKLWTYLACIYESGGFKEDALAMVNTYKALFGPPKEGREAHAVCQSDADCVLAPCSRPPVVSPVLPSPGFDESSQLDQRRERYKDSPPPEFDVPSQPDEPSQSLWSPFSAMTKAEAEIQYAIGQCRGTLCNGKCRCGDEETAIAQGSITYSSKCINSQCVLSSPYQQIPASIPSQEKKHTPSDSGQR